MSLATNVLLQGMNSNTAVSIQIRAEKCPLGVAPGEGHGHLSERKLSLRVEWVEVRCPGMRNNCEMKQNEGGSATPSDSLPGKSRSVTGP